MTTICAKCKHYEFIKGGTAAGITVRSMHWCHKGKKDKRIDFVTGDDVYKILVCRDINIDGKCPDYVPTSKLSA